MKEFQCRGLLIENEPSTSENVIDVGIGTHRNSVMILSYKFHKDIYGVLISLSSKLAVKLDPLLNIK